MQTHDNALMCYIFVLRKDFNAENVNFNTVVSPKEINIKTIAE